MRQEQEAMDQNAIRIRLTSGELMPLWIGYLGDTMAKCMLSYFLQHVEDEEIRPILEFGLDLAKEHTEFKNKLFKNEQFPIPHGFTDQDVNLHAPRLFSDSFMLLYVRNMGIAGMVSYSMGLASSSRKDIRAFFNHNLNTAAELLEKSTTLLQFKGLLPRIPYIPYPNSVEYVRHEGWLNGLLGDRRPLNAAEITQLFLNIMNNCVGQVLMMGFSQAAKSKEVAKYIVRGREIASKHIEVFSALLRDDQLPAPMTWETDVSESTEPPFSDKLMLYHAVFLSALGLGNYGAALAGNTRRDLAGVYLRLAAEISTFADDGAELMIRSGWMEKMPGAIERDALLSV